MKIYMIKCPKCNMENYIFSVPSGTCTWCGYIAKEKDVNDKTVWTETLKPQKDLRSEQQ